MAYFCLFFHAIISFLLWPAKLAENNTDHLSLLAIKSSITQDPQRVLGTWNTSLHFCQWLENNSFNGVIQPQLCSLFRLQRLVLINNAFEGEVPSSLSNCTSLEYLNLAENKLVGRLPQQFSSLVNLVYLTIHGNSFTGGIPFFMANLTSLESISAVDNHLGGIIPNVFGELHNLKQIGFGTNQLHGMIPPSLYNLTSLKVVSFPDNQINGGLPKDIGMQLPDLEIFQIWSNNFTGSIPFSFSNCSNLVHLSLASNGFTGKININFRQIPNFKQLLLDHNSLGSGEPDEMNFIDSMTNCSNLELLMVQVNQLRGVLPTSLANLSSQLTSVFFSNNFIHGTLPSEIGNLVKLERLSMQENQLTVILPSELGNLGNLKQLFLGDNKFIGNFPDSISNLSLLFDLDLSINRLEGQIPLNLGNCKSLVKLNLSVNNLTGTIPRELFQLSSLIYLDLSQNHLVGPLPQEIGNLKSLTILNLSQNDLVGEMPDAITGRTSLEYLDLKANSFEGPIPPAFRRLRGIKDLDLSSNNFSGKIPIFLEQLNLSTLNLSFNNLDGEVPVRGIFKNASAVTIDGNNGLCGGLPELALPKCDLVVARSKKGSRLSLVIFIVIPLCSFLVLSTALSLLICWKRRKKESQPTGASPAQPFSRVSYGSILKATDEFTQRHLIGTGAFSAVYKGILEAGGAMVAIKVLKLGNEGAFKSYMAECEALKNIRHRNLVKLITSCSSVDYQGNDFKALIYELMPNGNLDSWLHPSQEQETENEEAAPPKLSLGQRVTVAIDVAHAIHYLHQDCEIPIIHCDLKPSNILLDNDMVAHIGDFGLAKFLPLKPHESSSIGIRGTIGYAAPEYGLGSEMTKEGDIYSFGILLLEMITGKRPTDQIFEQGLNLHRYVKRALPDHIMEIVEPAVLHALKEEMEAANVNHRYRYSEDEAIKWKKFEEGMVSLARTGLACSMESPRERMDTNRIIHELHHINGILVMPLINICKSTL